MIRRQALQPLRQGKERCALTSQDNLLVRVEKLERQNRRMKRIGCGIFIVVGAVLLMGQTHQPAIPVAVTARAFVLVDQNGSTRARLSTLPSGPILVLYDAKGNPRMILDGREPSPGLTIATASGEPELSLDINPSNGAELALFSPVHKGGTLLLNVAADGPTAELDDANGFETTIGVTDLIAQMTGETSKTSAASIKLFGKGKTVLWSAP